MLENLKANILWLSDIHLRSMYDRIGLDIWLNNHTVVTGNGDFSQEDLQKDYSEKLTVLPFIESYVESFLEIVKEYPSNIDYVLISGDLSFSSTREDFELLNKMIIEKLKKITGPKTKFITIPGNHDVFWKKSEFFKHFIERIKIKKEGWQDNGNFWKGFFENYEYNFVQLFKNYTTFFIDNIKDTLKGNLLIQNYEKGLHGVIIDKDKNLIINLFNSAWFALGQNFDTILIESFIKETTEQLFDSASNGEKDFKQKTFKRISFSEKSYY